MKSRELEYELPEGLIAQHPAEHRDDSRLLVYDRSTGETRHRRFTELAEELAPGELVVVNDTKVIPARLRVRRPSGGATEILLLETVEDCLARSGLRPSQFSCWEPSPRSRGLLGPPPFLRRPSCHSTPACALTRW